MRVGIGWIFLSSISSLFFLPLSGRRSYLQTAILSQRPLKPKNVGKKHEGVLTGLKFSDGGMIIDFVKQ